LFSLSPQICLGVFSDISGTPILIPDFDLKTTITSAEHVAVTFKFKAFAYPMPVFKWFKLCDFSSKILINDKKYEIKTLGLYSSLTISDIAKDDYGSYKLMINNTVGQLVQYYLLKANGIFIYIRMFYVGVYVMNKYCKRMSGGIIYFITIIFIHTA
jgi:hypothetical protein